MSHTKEHLKFHERHAWIVFLLITLVLALVGFSGEEGPVGPGSVLHAFQTSDVSEDVLDLRFRGTVLGGMIIFGLAVLFGGFRKGERWAWYAMWYYPVFFVLHIIAFGTVMPDAIFLLLSLLGLILPYRVFFPSQKLVFAS